MPTSNNEERRRAPRRDYDCLVLVAYGDEGFLGHVDNVSASGCCISRPEDWSLANGTEVRLFLLIDLRHVFCAAARVVWSSAQFVGFQYLEPQPLPP